MPLFNDGKASDTAASIRHGEAMEIIRRELAGLRFPTSKREVVEAKGRLELPTEGGHTLLLGDLLRGVNATEFTSADHVAEVARLAWSLPTEMEPPEGSG